MWSLFDNGFLCSDAVDVTLDNSVGMGGSDLIV